MDQSTEIECVPATQSRVSGGAVRRRQPKANRNLIAVLRLLRQLTWDDDSDPATPGYLTRRSARGLVEPIPEEQVYGPLALRAADQSQTVASDVRITWPNGSPSIPRYLHLPRVDDQDLKRRQAVSRIAASARCFGIRRGTRCA